MLPKQALSIFRGMSCSKYVKVNLAKPQCHIMLNKINSNKNLKIQTKKKKLCIQINKFEFNKDKTNKTIGLRMLERNALGCGLYIYCENDSQFWKKLETLNKIKMKL